MNPRRAVTPEQKRAVVERILKMWELVPGLRLGQLLVNAHSWRRPGHNDIFHDEDLDLAESVESIVKNITDLARTVKP